MNNLQLINALMKKDIGYAVKIYDPVNNTYYEIQDVVTVEDELGESFIEVL